MGDSISLGIDVLKPFCYWTDLIYIVVAAAVVVVYILLLFIFRSEIPVNSGPYIYLFKWVTRTKQSPKTIVFWLEDTSAQGETRSHGNIWPD